METVAAFGLVTAVLAGILWIEARTGRRKDVPARSVPRRRTASGPKSAYLAGMTTCRSRTH
ncbi:hypothetical protein [Actinomadura hibisca]|uniref:hypothetical protein n=1 Tax=Actinomadura hibisca TaxID=68565 RepID=UPI000830B543|nr:hypothetical protein [Actinomadura hibisca]